MPGPRRFPPPEYKAEVVELIHSTGKTVGQVARELDLTETAVRQWIRQAERDAGHRHDGLTTAEREELGRLRHEVRELRRANEIPQVCGSFLRRQCQDEARPVGFARFFAAQLWLLACPAMCGPTGRFGPAACVA
jgi:transposase